MKNIKYIGACLLMIVSSTVGAINITVPSAPGVGFMLISTTTGAYIATSTSSFIISNNLGSQWATSTASATTIVPAGATNVFIGGGSGPTPFATLEVQGTTTTATGRAFAVWNSAATNLLTVQNNGNVGVGTTTPFAQLAVNAPAGSAAFVIGSSTATSFIVDKVGNVGVGTVNPSQKLDVAGNMMVENGTDSRLYLGDANTYLKNEPTGYRFVTDKTTISFYAGGAEKIFFQSTGFYPTVDNSMALGQSGNRFSAVTIGTGNSTFAGNVGVGTTSPSAKFVVSGSGTGAAVGMNIDGDRGILNAQSGSLTFTNKNTNLAQINGYTGATGGSVNYGQLVFSTANAGTLNERMRIDENGNVGIGTTTPNNLLTLQSNSAANIQLSQNSGGTGIGARISYDQVGFGRASLAFGTATGGNGYASIFVGVSGNTEALRVDSTGNVGIGTTTPSQKLEVNGNIKLTESVIGAGGNRTIDFGSAYGNVALRLFNGGAGSNWGWGLNAGEMQFFGVAGGSNHISFNKGGDLQTVGTNEVMRVDLNSGNVGVGTTTPTDKLDVNGNARIENQGQLRFEGLRANGSAYASLSASSTMTSNVNWTLPKVDGTNGQELLTNGAGNLYFGTVAGANYLTNSGSNTYLNTGSNLQAPSVNATSTTATSTFMGNVSITDGTNYGFVTGAQPLIISGTNNFPYQQIISNKSTGGNALSGYTLANANTTNGANPFTDVYYAGIYMAGSGFNLYPGLRPNDIVLVNSDAGVNIASLSSTSPRINFANGNNFTTANWDITMVGQSTTGNSFMGIATTTPKAPLHINATTTPQILLTGADTDPGVSIRNIGGHEYHASTSPTTYATSTNAAIDINYNAGVTPGLGIGTTSPFATLSVVNTSGSSMPLFAISSSSAILSAMPVFEIDNNGHVMYSGPKPTCDANCTFVGGNDSRFRITTGIAKTTMTITFANSWPTAPVCSANDEGGTVFVSTAPTTSTVVITPLSALTSVNISVSCDGFQ